jgi:hypothetical protein
MDAACLRRTQGSKIQMALPETIDIYFGEIWNLHISNPAKTGLIPKIPRS